MCGDVRRKRKYNCIFLFLNQTLGQARFISTSSQQKRKEKGRFISSGAFKKMTEIRFPLNKANNIYIYILLFDFNFQAIVNLLLLLIFCIYQEIFTN